MLFNPEQVVVNTTRLSPKESDVFAESENPFRADYLGFQEQKLHLRLSQNSPGVEISTSIPQAVLFKLLLDNCQNDPAEFALLAAKISKKVSDS